MKILEWVWRCLTIALLAFACYQLWKISDETHTSAYVLDRASTDDHTLRVVPVSPR